MSLSDHIIDTCDHGHKFAKLDDHPGNSCVHCLRLGLASARAEVEQLREDKAAERERDFLIAEYERAVNCGPQGFAHAAGHLFNAIVNARADTNTKQLLALRDERDALAAHVERLRKASLDAIPYLSGGEIKAELRDAYDDTPETSLARMKAQWQAEALETVASISDFEDKPWDAAMLHHLAATMRRQAEGDEP